MSLAIPAASILAVAIAYLVIRSLRSRVSVTHHTEWSIGIYTGNSPLSLGPDFKTAEKGYVLSAADISDVRARFVADPFLFRKGPQWHLFFEVYNIGANRGEIGLATSTDGFHYSYERIVLSEPFHVSYPYIFAHEEAMYMVPESAEAKSIRLYKAVQYPYSWTFVKELVKGSYCDSSIFNFQGKWWIFTCFEPSHDKSPEPRHNDLHLFFADSLQGPFIEHPKSPIVKGNAHVARPGGRIILFDGKIIRFAQDSQPTYGKSLNALQVTVLTETDFEEQALGVNPILTASGKGWNRHGMHHLDAHELENGTWIGCVDGYRKFYSIHLEY